MRSCLALTCGYCLWAALILAGPLRGSEIDTYYPLIMAGAAPDSPADRIDLNTTTSPFAGVGALRIKPPGSGSFLATAVPITRRHILTAAHSVDRDNNGIADVPPGGLTFRLNFGSDLSHMIAASAVAVHPDFTGFGNPWVNDDLAVITLSEPLPSGVPVYDLYRTPLSLGDEITMVGYGWSGAGDSGYSTGPNPTVKRVGRNVVDKLEADDEGVGPEEVFIFDFDGPAGPPETPNFLGGGSLGNGIEAQLGHGDSGGPSFIFVDDAWKLAGVNTIGGVFAEGPSFPRFGSAGGGMVISAYADWIDEAVVPEPSSLIIWSLLAVVGIGGGWWRRRRKAA